MASKQTCQHRQAGHTTRHLHPLQLPLPVVQHSRGLRPQLPVVQHQQLAQFQSQVCGLGCPPPCQAIQSGPEFGPKQGAVGLAQGPSPRQAEQRLQQVDLAGDVAAGGEEVAEQRGAPAGGRAGR
jgi:hypothetical protein